VVVVVVGHACRGNRQEVFFACITDSLFEHNSLLIAVKRQHRFTLFYKNCWK
jgi:hypothetical protein